VEVTRLTVLNFVTVPLHPGRRTPACTLPRREGARYTAQEHIVTSTELTSTTSPLQVRVLHTPHSALITGRPGGR
jgi:hypothetical protein